VCVFEDYSTPGVGDSTYLKQPRATHVLRDGEAADADEREEAAAVPAGSDEGWWSDPSHESSEEHARSCTHAPAPSRTSTSTQHVHLPLGLTMRVHTRAHDLHKTKIDT
jgi:hypothetical protein